MSNFATSEESMADDPVLRDEWHVVATVADVPPAQVLAVRLLEQDIVLWNDGASIHAWQNLCIHRGAQLSGGSVRDGCLVCPYHGWTYRADGQCTRFPAHPSIPPPAKAHARVFQVRQRYGLVWVSLGLPLREVPDYPEAEDASFRVILCGPYRIQATGPRVIENFLDVAHFPFVHEGSLGEASQPEIGHYDAIISENGVAANDIAVWQPDPDGTGQSRIVRYDYHAARPLTAFLRKADGENRFALMNTVTPVGRCESLAWVVEVLNYAPEMSDRELREFQDKITLQDVPILESQRPELLPLDLREELHLRSDRTAIAYRTWLRQLGLTTGIA